MVHNLEIQHLKELKVKDNLYSKADSQGLSLEQYQQTVKGLTSLHKCAGWSGLLCLYLHVGWMDAVFGWKAGHSGHLVYEVYKQHFQRD